MLMIAPSILSTDWSRINDEIKEVEDFSDMIHVDIMDGVFVPNKTFGADFVRKIKTPLPLDVHLMVKEPNAKLIFEFVDAGAALITVHAEACDDLEEKILMIRDAGARPSIAINPITPMTCIESLLDIVQMVNIMTVVPGTGGQKFMPETLQKVAWLRNLKTNLDIEVDGGINAETIGLAAEAGANVFVAGSAVFGKKDRAAAIKELAERINRPA